MRFVPSERICPFFLLFPTAKEKIPLLNKYRPVYLYACGGEGRMDADRTGSKGARLPQSS